MGSKRRQLSDLRDTLRFPGKAPSEIHTVSGNSPLMRIFRIFSRPAHAQKHNDVRPRSLTQPLALMTRIILQSINQVCRYSSWVRGHVLQRGEIRPIYDDNRHLWSSFSASMTNHLRIQRDVMSHILSYQDIDSIVICTASVYLHLPRILQWLRHEAAGCDFASMQISEISEWSYGGTVTYFSRAGAEQLVNAANLRFGDLHDVAIGHWIRETERSWKELPAAQYQDPSDEGFCLLCKVPDAVAVVCTSSADRSLERARMGMLHNHNEHAG